MQDLYTSYKDNCGFGLIASIDNRESHQNVKDALKALSRMMHRGAIAADGKSGDGSGLLFSMKINGEEMLAAAVRPSFWRAPIDNDFGNGMDKRQGLWRHAGDDLQLMNLHFVRAENGHVMVNTGFLMKDVQSELKISYDFSGGGSVKIKMEFEPGIKGLPDFPRFGMVMVLKNADNLEYYGRGPQENYCDRNSAAFVGDYSSTVSQQYFPYIRPQENGYKTDTRWLITGNQKNALFVESTKPFSFSALHIPMSMLDQITRANHKHINDVKPAKETYLHIDMKQMGVGGDDSWGARPHKQYRIPVKEYQFGFTIKPCKTGENGFVLWDK